MDSEFTKDKQSNSDLFRSLAVGCTINNTSRIDFEKGVFRRVGEPTEAALKVLAEKICGNPSTSANAFDFEKEMKSKIEIIAKLDFTSERKAMSTVVTGYNNGKDMLLKGAPDRIMGKCTSYMSLSGKKQMTESDRQSFTTSINNLAAQGLRVLAIAEIPNAGALSSITLGNKQSLLGDIKKYSQYEQEATLVGIVGIKDPIREEIKPAIQDCYTAGIRVIMITGDSKETAMSIAKELDIINDSDDVNSCVFTGS